MAEAPEKAGSRLRAAVEQGVPAPGVRQQGMELPHAVPQLHVVPFTGAAAVLIAGAVRQEGAEHAVLHVEHGHVLVQSQFKPFRRRGAEQVLHLSGVQVIGNGEIIQVPPFLQDGRAVRIGDIQGKIPDAVQGGMAEVLRRAQVADEDAVRAPPVP